MPNRVDPHFPHYMLQEIYEQPETLRLGVERYFAADGFARSGLDAEQVRALRKVTIVASGSSRLAGLVGEFLLERLLRLPVEVDYSSQYCYRDPLSAMDELVVFLTQSGTTADTLHAARLAKERGGRTLAICNVAGAPITEETDGVLYTHAGEEVAIAATKSFTAQLLALLALALHFAELRKIVPPEKLKALRRATEHLPKQAAAALENDPIARRLAAEFKDVKQFMFLGRDISFPIALEASLKMKETAYLAAEAFPTGEVRHGPTALVDENLPVAMLLTREPGDRGSEERWMRSVPVLNELAERGAKVTVVTNEDSAEVRDHAHAVMTVAQTSHLLSPVLEIIPLQLLSYHLAVERGVNVDTPRNLSKSVITE